MLTRARSRRDELVFAAGLSGAALLALALTSYRLAQSGLTFDEAATATYAALDVHELLAALQRSDAFFGTYYAVMHLWMHIGTSEAVLRWFSVVCAVLAVVAVGMLARRLAGTGTGIVAGVFAAASPLLFDVARQARPYALLVFVAALSSLAFLRAVERPTRRRWAAYAGLGIAGCYIHLFLACLIVAHGAWALAFGRRALRTGLVWALAAIAAATIPLLAVLRHYPVVNGYIARPTWHALLDTLDWFAGSRALLLTVIAAAILAVASRVRVGTVRLSPAAAFLVMTATLPLLLVFAESSFGKPAYLQRYLVEAWPAWIAGTASIVTRVRPAALAATAVAVVAALQTHAVLTTHMQVAQHWRAASALILAHAVPGDALVVYPPFGMLPYDYYRAHDRARFEPVVRFPRSSPFPLTMNGADDDKFTIGTPPDMRGGRPERIWFLVGWNDDARTAKGLRVLVGALPPAYALAFARHMVHEDVLRFDVRPSRR